MRPQPLVAQQGEVKPKRPVRGHEKESRSSLDKCDHAHVLEWERRACVKQRRQPSAHLSVVGKGSDLAAPSSPQWWRGRDHEVVETRSNRLPGKSRKPSVTVSNTTTQARKTRDIEVEGRRINSVPHQPGSHRLSVRPRDYFCVTGPWKATTLSPASIPGTRGAGGAGIRLTEPGSGSRITSGSYRQIT